MHFTIHPYLQQPAADGMVVAWETDERCTPQLLVWEAFCPACGTVEYKPVGKPLVFTGPQGQLHRIRASGLQPGRDYCYRAVSTAGEAVLESELGVFRTKPCEDAPCSFVVVSETGGSRSTQGTMEAVANAMAAERPDFLLFLGDMVYDGHRGQDWQEYLFIPFRRLIAHTPFYHCAGNHEDHSASMGDYLGTPPQGCYDFTYGCAHFVALDSTLLCEHVADEKDIFTIQPIAPLTVDNPQIAFLTASLRASSTPWKFVYLHYPPYFSGTWEAAALRPLCAIFEACGVDIVFTSHAIVYDRSHAITQGQIDEHRGVRYLVVGGAGARPHWFHHKKAWHTAKSRAVPHFVHISATAQRLEMQAIDQEGRLFDALTLYPRPRENA